MAEGHTFAGMRYAHTGTTRDGGCASCDKAQLVFRLRKGRAQALLDWIAGQNWLVFDHWVSRKIGSYRDQFSIIAAKDGESFWLGVGLNGPGQPVEQVKLEFNPNKTWPRVALVRVLVRLHQLSKAVELKQWDYAVDWPEPREQFTLMKDARLYEETTRSRADRTQYVGQRNKPGRCKLYNKQIEAGLPGSMTRLEMTVDGAATAAQAAEDWPTVWRLTEAQTGPEVAALNDTDRFILGVLLEYPDKLRDLGRRKREKMAGLLEGLRYLVEFDEAAFNEVARFARSFLDPDMVGAAQRGRPSWAWPDEGEEKGT